VEPSKEEIVKWCQAYVADVLEMRLEAVDPHADFDKIGLDSALAVSLLIAIEEKYGIDLPPEELFEDPTLDAVASSVADRLRQHAA
jgi:acyl carrier protein